MSKKKQFDMVDVYATQMKAGAFSRKAAEKARRQTGVVINGHHRLKAVLKKETKL